MKTQIALKPKLFPNLILILLREKQHLYKFIIGMITFQVQNKNKTNLKQTFEFIGKLAKANKTRIQESGTGLFHLRIRRSCSNIV